jgi:O-acetyl-ADP-ribose deacetylase (regulator of RNase III)
MVTEKEVDIFDSGAVIAAQCCNCQCTQGSGIAWAIRQKFPEVYDDDLQTVKGDRLKLGTVRIVKLITPHPTLRYIANCYGQFNFGRENRQMSYEAMYRCFESLKGHVANTNLILAFPYKISCKLAGGSWRVVREMIFDVFEDSPREVFICRKPGDE